MKRTIICFIIVGSIFLISLFKGCSCNPTYHGTGYYAPAWSADGTRIYYFRNDLTVEKHTGFLVGETYEYKKNEWYICSCDVNGGSRKTIYKIGEFSGKLPSELWRMIMDISQDGKILYSVTTAIKSGIWIINTDGSDDHQLLSWGKNPRWAYNYSKIVFEGEGNKEGIWLMDKDGSNVSQVLTEGSSPAFCDANEKMLYHIWPADGYGQLYCYSFADSSVDTLVEGASADWSPTGEKFAYFYGSGGYPLIFQFSDSSSTTITTPDMGYKVIRWSEINKIVSYNSGIWVMNPDGSEFKVIIKDDLEHLYGD
jgi:Tol biopolymer transport system component